MPKGVIVWPSTVDDLHSDNNKLSKENSLDERVHLVSGRGDSPIVTTVLTGSGAAAHWLGDACSFWTAAGEGSPCWGINDRQGVVVLNLTSLAMLHTVPRVRT